MTGIDIEEIPYIFRLLFFLCFLHTVEVGGSNPLSPTILIIIYLTSLFHSKTIHFTTSKM